MKKLLISISIVFLATTCEFPVESDTTPPTVTITFPVDGSTLTALTTVRATASDNEEVVQVSFIVDGITVFEDTESPYEYEWDVCALDSAQHTLIVEAKDESDNVGQSELMTFTTNGDYDCEQVCGGVKEEDNCGVCDDNSENDCLQDCAGVWGGNALEDICGVCDSNPSNDGSYDQCGNCDNNPDNDCEQDCAGVWGGTNWESDCGCVTVNNSGDDCGDCTGEPYGNAQVLTYWYDGDGDGLGAGQSQQLCDALVEEGWVLNGDDEDDNCYSNIFDCAGV